MDDAQHKRILVTGGTGFIGSHVLRHLWQQGFTRLSALHRTHSRFDLAADLSSQIDWREGDLLDVPGLENVLCDVDIVIHCAGLVSYRSVDRQALFDVNETGTANLVNLALHYGVGRFVHISSTAALGRNPYGGEITEASKWEPHPHHTIYAISKHQAERQVWRGAAEGLSVVVLNPSIVLGEGRPADGIGPMLQQVAKGLTHYPPGANGWVHVQDVIEAITAVLTPEIQQERFIISAANLSYRTVLNEIAALMKRPAPTRVLQGRAVKFYRWWQSLSSQLRNEPAWLTQDLLLNLLHDHSFDNTKSKQLLDLDYRSPLSALPQMVAAFRA